MSIEIIPAGASAVVTERHDGSKHPDRWDLSSQMQRDSNQAASEAERKFVEMTNQAERNLARTLDNVHEVDESVIEVATASALASTVAQKQVSDSATSTVVGFKDAQALAYQVQGQALLEAAKNFNGVSVQATSNFNASQVQGNLMQYNILLDAQKSAAAASLLATQIAAAAAAAAAECCCELSGKIGDDGQKTRDLINAIQASDLRDRAQRSEAALAAYFAAKAAPTTPVV